MDNEKDILAQAESIINASAEQVEKDHKAQQLKHFVQIESAMFEEFGFDDEGAHMFHMTMIANTPEEVRELQRNRTEQKRTNVIPPDDPNEEANRAMKVELVVSSGDAYEILKNRKMSLGFANEDNGIGCILRVAAHQSAEAESKGVKPSEALDKQDAIITIMITDERIQTISRLSKDTEEIHTQVIDMEDYEPDKERLLDALVMYYIFPKAMKQEEPKMFNALLKDYKEKS